MKIDKYGLNLIIKFESCKLTAYKVDNAEKYYTIGYGHYVKQDVAISLDTVYEILTTLGVEYKKKF